MGMPIASMHGTKKFLINILDEETVKRVESIANKKISQTNN